MVVLVMNHFARIEKAAKLHFHHGAMLGIPAARIRLGMQRHPQTDIAVLFKHSAAFPLGMSGTCPRTCALRSLKTQALHSTLDGCIGYAKQFRDFALRAAFRQQSAHPRFIDFVRSCRRSGWDVTAFQERFEGMMAQAELLRDLFARPVSTYKF